MKKHKFTHTDIEHHDDGSATIHHTHEDGKSHKHHAVADLDGVHDSLEDHLGSPNPGEAEAEAGDHGVPAEHAAPAGLAAPGGAAPMAAPQV